MYKNPSNTWMKNFSIWYWKRWAERTCIFWKEKEEKLLNFLLNCGCCRDSVEMEVLCLAPEIVQEQQKQTEYIYLLRYFPVPLGKDSSDEQGCSPFLGAAQRVLGDLQVITSCGQSSPAASGLSASCYSPRIRWFDFVFSWLILGCLQPRWWLLLWLDPTPFFPYRYWKYLLSHLQSFRTQGFEVLSFPSH